MRIPAEVQKYVQNADADQLRDLNHFVVQTLNAKNAMADARAIVNFSVGQKVSFTGKRGRKMVGVVEKIGRSGLIIACEPLFGATAVPERWRVNASNCQPEVKS